MPLPRSVLVESGDSFVARRIESNKFRGFSFIQEDFLLPDRDADELEKYWNSADEEGESDSECASSKAGDEPQVPLEPEKKKRPPRKKKKKNKVAVINGAATMPIASSIDVMNTPLLNGYEKVDSTQQNGPIPPAVGEAGAPTEVGQRALEMTISQNPEAAILPKVQQAPKAGIYDTTKGGPQTTTPRQQSSGQMQQPYSLNRSTNQKYVPPPQRRGVGGMANGKPSTPAPNQQQRPVPRQEGWAGPQQQHYQQQTFQKNNGWTVANQTQHPSAQSGRGWGAQGGGRGWGSQPASTQRHQNMQSQPTRNTVSTNTPRGPNPGSWAGKIHTQNIGSNSQRAAAGPKAQPYPNRADPSPHSPQNIRQTTEIVPPSPSSDWRNHTISPSPRKMAAPDVWPGLGDFPPPPDLGKPKTAPKAAKPLKGAWGAKR